MSRRGKRRARNFPSTRAQRRLRAFHFPRAHAETRGSVSARGVDGDDLQLPLSCGRLKIHALPHALIHQRPRDRREPAHRAALEVRFIHPHDPVARLLPARLAHCHRHAEAHLIRCHCVRLDDLRSCKNPLQLGDPFFLRARHVRRPALLDELREFRTKPLRTIRRHVILRTRRQRGRCAQRSHRLRRVVVFAGEGFAHR